MPVVEIEVKDDGSIGTLPDPVQKFLDSKIKEAFGKGASKTAEEAKAQIDAEIKKAKEAARLEAKREMGGELTAAEREQLKDLKDRLSKAEEEKALREQNFEEAQRIREERYAREIKEREDKYGLAQKELERRTARIRELATKEIRVAASSAGAREESLDELEYILSRRIGLDPESLQAFVASEDNPAKPALDDGGEAVSIEGLVQSYLAAHPHHKAPNPGQPGRARGGSSLTGKKQTAEEAAREAAFVDLKERPTIENVAKALKVVGSRAS